jgi:hypothetical protein
MRIVHWRRAKGVGRAVGIFRSMLPLESLFRDLNDRGGRYVVVGGLAVVLHGHLRATGDVDLVVDLARDQVDRTLAALEGAGFQPYVPVPSSEFADPVKRAAWVREKGMLVFSLRPRSGVPMVDLFLEYPMAFDQMWDRSVVVNLRGVPVRIASIEDLIALEAPGRPPGRPHRRRGADRHQTTARRGTVSADSSGPGRLPPDREALIRTTLALSVDERVAWLEAMMAIAIDSGALPKRVPDQVAGARLER